MVFGNLNAHNVAAAGYMVVMGQLRVPGLYYGVRENFPTMIYGDAEVGTLVTGWNHAFGVHGRASIGLEVADERDGWPNVIETLRAIVNYPADPKNYPNEKIIAHALRAQETHLE